MKRVLLMMALIVRRADASTFGHFAAEVFELDGGVVDVVIGVE